MINNAENSSRGRTWLLIAFSIFPCLFYTPLTSKSINNYFYLTSAITAAWLLRHEKQSLLLALKGNATLLLLLAVVAVLGFKNLGFEDLENVKTIVHFLCLFCCCHLVYHTRKNSFDPWLPFVIASMAIFAISAANWVFIGITTHVWVRYAEIFGNYVNPVFAATLITTALCYAYLFYIHPKASAQSIGRNILTFVVFVGLVVFCCTMFNSRSTLIGFALFVFSLMLYGKFLRTGIFVTVVVVRLSYWFGAIDVLTARGNSYRFAIWMDAYNRVMSDECGMWLGCGPVAGYRFLGEFYNTHSSYVDVFYRSGIIGISLFAIFCAAYFYRSLKYKSQWAMLSLIGFGTSVTGGAKIFTSPQPFWIYLWLPIFLALIESTEKARSDSPPPTESAADGR